MRILLSYVVTENVVDRFLRTIRFQDLFPSAVADLDRVVITDSSTQIQFPFPVIRSILYVSGKFYLVGARNAALQYAHDHGYDYLLDGDADRVLLSLPQCLPQRHISCVMLHSQSKAESEEALAKKVQDGDLNYEWSSWFIVPRPLMQYRFHGEYLAYGYEDLDYVHNVLAPLGINICDAGARGVHLYHALTTSSEHEAFKRNKSIYEKRWAELHPEEEAPCSVQSVRGI
jgi:hypothetical protein